MSPSEPPREVLAIAVALAVALQEAEAAEPQPVEPDAWRWGGRRWERPAGHRWS